MTDASGRVLILDTTLRDGEQAPGCSMTQPEKLRIARALAELGVDVIEAGFPAASRGDWESVNAVARDVQGPIIAGLARCVRKDIEQAAEALKNAPHHRLHLFLATSAIHREFKLKMARGEIIRRAVEGVGIAREFCSDVEFSPEDASRTELEFLAEVVESVIEAGATTINIPDTVGYAVPPEYGEVFRYLRAHVRGIEGVTLSAHCHDDLGMAVANSLAAVTAGARQIECTINGIGERAGNCSLEEAVMALATRAAFYKLGTTVRTERLYSTSRLVASITGVTIPRNKAIIGQNAFAHESGIHQHGTLQNRATYEIMKPEDIGLPRSQLVLGKHSGRHAFRERLKLLGFELTEAELGRVFEEFKALADRKKELFDGDIDALVLRAGSHSKGPWTLDTIGVEVRSGSRAVACANLRHTDGRALECDASGEGPVDATYKAIIQATGIDLTVKKFEIQAVTIGDDAQAEAILQVEAQGRSYQGSSVSTNMIEAASHALLEVINQIELSQRGEALMAATSRQDMARLTRDAI